MFKTDPVHPTHSWILKVTHAIHYGWHMPSPVFEIIIPSKLILGLDNLISLHKKMGIQNQFLCLIKKQLEAGFFMYYLNRTCGLFLMYLHWKFLQLRLLKTEKIKVVCLNFDKLHEFCFNTLNKMSLQE